MGLPSLALPASWRLDGIFLGSPHFSRLPALTSAMMVRGSESSGWRTKKKRYSAPSARGTVFCGLGSRSVLSGERYPLVSDWARLKTGGLAVLGSVCVGSIGAHRTY